MAKVKITLTDAAGGATVLDLGLISDDGRQGKWLIQVVSPTGSPTLTPTISADGGTTYTAVAMTPVTGGAVVALVTGVGAWYIEGSGGRVKLTLTGTTVSMVVSAVPCLF